MRLFSGFLRLVRKLTVVVVIVGLVGGTAWAIYQMRVRGERTLRFRTESATRGRVAALINASGTVVPEEVVDVGAQVAGRITEFGPDLDDSRKTIDYRSRVEQGTILARIDDALYAPEVGIARADLAVSEAEVDRLKADLEAARARADQATRDLQRARRGGGSVSSLELDAAAAAQETARVAVPSAAAGLEKAKKAVGRSRAALDKAEKNLEYTVIRSPVKGVIIDRRVNIGQTVVASLNAPSLFLIAKDLRRMQVWASVNEADIGRIHVGMPAMFRVDTYPDEVFTGEVAQIRLNASMAQNVVTYTVVVNTDNDRLKLLPYLTANLQFRAAVREDALLVSNAALRYRPAPDRVHPDYRALYAELRRRKTSAHELKAGSTAVDHLATVWLEDGGYLVPVQLLTGITDGAVTEVAELVEGELNAGDPVITGEIQGEVVTGSNPFAIKMWNGKKKERD